MPLEELGARLVLLAIPEADIELIKLFWNPTLGPDTKA